VERYFDRFLYPPLGLRLIKWQRDTIRTIYGSASPDTGLRRIRSAYIEVPKKNGKSFLIGGLPIYHLDMEHERNPKAFGAAAAKEQAGLVFEAAAQLINANQNLKAKFNVLPSTKTILRRDGGGTYKVLSADGRFGAGIEPSLAIKDEYHVWHTARSEMLDQEMTKGMIARGEPLEVKITTAGSVYDSPLCYREHEYAKRALNGSLKSDRYYAAIYSADTERFHKDPDYWKSRESRELANPSHEAHGGFLKDEAIVAELDKAIADPVSRNWYLRYHLNLWVDSEERYISAEEWAKCGGKLRSLVGRKCYIGLDLSATLDLTAMIGVFPDTDGTYDIQAAFWMGEGQLETRERLDRAPYKLWRDLGILDVSQSWAVDEEDVRRKIKLWAELYDIVEIGYDPRLATSLVNNLTKHDGFECRTIPQGYPHLTEPTKKIKELAGAGKFRHGNNPILNWNCDCAAATGNRNEGVMFAKPDRGKSGKRIDGMSALANAMHRALAASSEKQSVYATRGLLSI